MICLLVIYVLIVHISFSDLFLDRGIGIMLKTTFKEDATRTLLD